MRKFLFLLPLFALLASAGAATITSSNLLSYGTVDTTTNNGGNVLVGKAYIAIPPTFVIQSGGLATTNALLVNIQFGLDQTNFTTIYQYTQAVTNALDGTVSPGSISLNVYARTQVITTNSVNVGTKAIFVSP